jgi:hypothetical protein
MTIMDNIRLDAALTDLVDAIRGACLGSVENAVIDAAAKELINNWNDHNQNDKIDESTELQNWEVDKQSSGQF